MRYSKAFLREIATAFTSCCRPASTVQGRTLFEPPDTWIPKGPKFCIFVAEVVEKLVPLRRVPCSRVRTDLSAAEKARYIAIVYSCMRDGCLPPLEPVVFSVGKCSGIVVPAGEFLNRLEAAGLVENCTCLVGGGIEAQLTPPERMCT